MLLGVGRLSCVSCMILRKQLGWRLVRGVVIFLWEDRWYSSNLLKFEAPIIFSMASTQKAKVANYWDQEGGGWSIQLRRHLND